LFCPECGTQIADNASFCRKCGAQLGERERPQQPVANATPPAQAPRPVAPGAAMSPQAGAARPVSSTFAIVGIVAIAGAAIAALGTYLPWIANQGIEWNGFDFGYITGSGAIDRDGKDGLILISIAIAAAALSITYFRNPNQLAGLGVLALGIAAASVAGYNFVKLFSDLNDADLKPLDYIGMGLYMSIVGGAITAVAALKGLTVKPKV